MNSEPVILMGVSGVGKSTVGELLADRLDVPFVDGDSLHSAEAVEKMRSGLALDDADREPWLDRIAAVAAAGRRDSRAPVIACSALRRTYRDRIRMTVPSARFVLLEGSAELIGERLRSRRGHFMPMSLLESQLAALEPPAADEHCFVASIALAPTEIVRLVAGWLPSRPKEDHVAPESL